MAAPDLVALVHPLLPGVTIHAHPLAVPAREASGWVKSSRRRATPAVETPTSPEGDALEPPSKEES